MWQLKAALPSSQSSRKKEIFSPDWSCPITAGARLSTLFSYCSGEEVLFFSTCFINASSWQPPSTVNKQHLRHLSRPQRILLHAASTQSLPPPSSVKISPEAVTRNNIIMGSFTPLSFRIFGSARGPFFRSHHIHLHPLEPKTLFNIFQTHVCITHQPRVSGVFFSCLTTASSKDSFLGCILPSARSTPRKHANLL